MTTTAFAPRSVERNLWGGVMPATQPEQVRAQAPSGEREEPGVAFAASADATPRADIAVEDWDVLFGAIKARLRNLAMDTPGSVLEMHERATPTRLQAGMLECVAALEQVQRTLRHELARRHEEHAAADQAGNGLAWVWADSSCAGLDLSEGWASWVRDVRTTSQD